MRQQHFDFFGGGPHDVSPARCPQVADIQAFPASQLPQTLVEKDLALVSPFNECLDLCGTLLGRGAIGIVEC
jgi:hypothetical protein